MDIFRTVVSSFFFTNFVAQIFLSGVQHLQECLHDVLQYNVCVMHEIFYKNAAHFILTLITYILAAFGEVWVCLENFLTCRMAFTVQIKYRR